MELNREGAKDAKKARNASVDQPKFYLRALRVFAVQPGYQKRQMASRFPAVFAVVKRTGL